MGVVVGRNHQVNISVRLDSDLLSSVQALAHQKGVPLNCLLGDAVAEFISSRRAERPREHVMTAFEGSYRQYDWLYRLLTE